MFAQALLPDQLLPTELDTYLERGWFRMGQTIFTTNFIHFKEDYYSTIWLRIVLDELREESTQNKLFKQNAIFRTEIRPAILSPEKDELYSRYKQPLPFQPSETLNTLLYGKTVSGSIYNTYEVAVYDKDTLIAFGFFDLGENSAAGIVSVYDPAYKKYSLGKYLIYQKIKFSREAGLRYFYPGYFVPGYKLFDYKLTIGKSALQFFKIATGKWMPIRNFTDQDIPIHTMQKALTTLQKFLLKDNQQSNVMKYEFFDANLVPELREAELFDFPLILTLSNHSQQEVGPIVVFDVRDGQYHILKCLSVWRPESPNPDPGIFGQHLLKVQQEILSDPNAGAIFRNDIVSS
ncbi:MAG TPA: GNAT family N-acetyltransferase [Ohtaekwangia sp.]